MSRSRSRKNTTVVAEPPTEVTAFSHPDHDTRHEDGMEVEETALVPNDEMADADEEANARTADILIDPNMPWAEWFSPNITPASLKELAVEVETDTAEGSESILRLGKIEPEQGQFQPIGECTTEGLRLLGWQTKFPVDFVEKLSPSLRAQVINERIQVEENRDRELSIVSEAGRVTGVLTGWKGVLPYADAAQVSYDTMREIYGDTEVEFAKQDDRGSTLRLMTAVEMPVTRRKGDILQMGIDVHQHYGETINVSLYCKRLVCLNGMMMNERGFDWTQRATGSVDHQIAWLRMAMAGALEAYEQLVTRARTMADTPLHGDPHTILREHARAMGLPERRLPALLGAFDQEPEETSWGLLNAFTRLATHGGLPQRLSRGLMQASGQWVSDFDLVTCRLPRPMAVAVGAQITEA